MIIKLTHEFKNMEGEPLNNPFSKDKPLTMLSLCVNALVGMDLEGEKTSGEDKMKRYLLAERMMENGKEIDLKADEIVTLKSLIAKRFAPIIVGPAWRILEPEEN